MIVEFATNNARTAKQYLEQAFPNASEATAAVIAEVVQLVADGKARVRDRHMYGGNTAIVPEAGHVDECVEVHKRLIAASTEDYYQENPERRPHTPEPLSDEQALDLIERTREVVRDWARHGINTTASVHLNSHPSFAAMSKKADSRGRLKCGDGDTRTKTLEFKANVPGRFYDSVTVFGPEVPKIQRKTKAAAA